MRECELRTVTGEHEKPRSRVPGKIGMVRMVRGDYLQIVKGDYLRSRGFAPLALDEPADVDGTKACLHA